MIPALREIIEERKEKAIESLSTSYAKNRLPLEEYERLVEYINKIESEREMVVVEKIVAEYDGYAGGAGSEASVSDDDEQDYYPQHHQSGSNMAVLSSRTFSGPLKSGSQFLSILGSGHIKVRKADLRKQPTVLNVASILGECVIFVEPGIRVINNTVPVLGGAWTDRKVGKEAGEGEPLLIIAGTAILGNVTVKLLRE